MKISSRRFFLRDHTSGLHARVDAAVGSFETIDDYRLYLAGIHRFRADLEDVIGSEPGELPRRIAHLAARDLDDLGVRALPKAGALQAFDGASERLGALYVLEGSSLGARILYQRALALGLTGQFGARHLENQADGLESWRGYLAMLDAAAPFDADRAVAGARRAFLHAVQVFAGINRLDAAS